MNRGTDWGGRIGAVFQVTLVGGMIVYGDWSGPQFDLLKGLLILAAAAMVPLGIGFCVLWVIGQIVDAVDRSIDRFADRCAGRRGEW